MSLRAFHILFICAAGLFLLGLAAWAIRARQPWMGMIGCVGGAALVPYLRWFIKKGVRPPTKLGSDPQ